MKRWLRSFPCLFAMSALGGAAPAHADFKLITPTAWIVEDQQGGPQTAGPCGPASDGDAMLTDAVTELKAGATIEVELAETMPHAGWYRIALAENRSELEDVSFRDASCASAVATAPLGNVLADGLSKTDAAGSTRTLKEKIRIPNKLCEKCTLQVIQVMTDASDPKGCVHYHCADVKIVAADGGAGMTASHASGGSSAASVPMRTSGGMGGDAANAGAPSTDPLIATASSQSGSAGTGSKPTNATLKHAAGGGAGGAGGKPAANSSKSAKSSASEKASESKSSDAGTDSGAGATGDDSSESEEAETTHEAKADDGGCSVSQPGSHTSLLSAALFALASVLLGVRRRRNA